MKRTSEAYSLLYDYYGALLSAKQRVVFEMYYEENLSLSEIAERLDVSRQAVHIALGKASESLDVFEEKLGLIAKHEAYEKALKEVETRTGVVLKDKERLARTDPELVSDLRRIKKLIKELDI